MVFTCLVGLGSVSRAQDSQTLQRPKAPEEVFEGRLRWGAVWHAGSQSDPSGFLLRYSGVTPNDLGGQLWAWPLFNGIIGFTAGISREGFGVFDSATNERLTSGGLLRGHAAVTARLRLGPARLEPIVGYGYHQLSDFAVDSASVQFRAGSRHGLLLGARAQLDLGPITLEGRFEYPLPLAVADAAGARAAASGLWAAFGVRAALFRAGSVVFGLMADVAYSGDTLYATNTSVQQQGRAGLSLVIMWKDPAPAPQAEVPTGALEIALAFDGETPEAKPQLAVETAGGALAPSWGQDNQARLDSVPVGPVTVRASLEGYEPTSVTGQVAASEVAKVTVQMKKVPPKPGKLLVTVIDKATKAALENVTVVVAGESKTTDAAGVVRFGPLKPGPTTVELSAPGYGPRSEGASILPELEASVTAEMMSLKKAVPATVSGFVRSAQTGAPIAAEVRILERKLKANVDGAGAFNFQVPGGSYTITVTAKGFTSQTKQFTVKDGDQAIFNLDLQPK